MKELRFLLLGLVICLASGVKAQFYDSADDIYYYVEYKNGDFVSDGNSNRLTGNVRVFNFDGLKGAVLNKKKHGYDNIQDVKANIKRNNIYYEDKVENTEYEMRYSGGIYKEKVEYSEYRENANAMLGTTQWILSVEFSYKFSSDRTYCYVTCIGTNFHTATNISYDINRTFTLKKVDKSFFRVGRSRTPSGTMYE